MIPLFEYYPALEDKLPYVKLGKLPTPVHTLEILGRKTGINSLYIKRDDLTGENYGGNKLRKLEFLLGEVLHSRAGEVITFGAAGSNHALATAFYSASLGLKSISMLVHQPNAWYVRNNLLMSLFCGAELHLYHKMPVKNLLVNPAVLFQLFRHRTKRGRFPRVIPMGGSSPRGVLGFVNAAFELKQQIMKGEIKEPDYLYVASGSMGTAAGLILGLKAAECKTKVVAVRVIDLKYVNEKAMINLISKTAIWLSSLDRSFPGTAISVRDFEIRHDFFGHQYALFSKKGMDAVRRLESDERIRLEGAYTGKAMAALLEDAQKQKINTKTVLFWNTYNSRDFSNSIAGTDYHRLPGGFHRYFEQPVQPLDY
ncbi:MAG: pyridoxal-phosphate dependent enzyme [Dehalococcoidales bacterium]|nr:pyridoxal-phosphate dependent enzyme [Dehalococcoidales bacterium]